MFWKKKKPKRKQPVKKQIPKHIADNLKYGESVAEGLKKGVSEVSEKPNRKKPAGKKSKKHLDARKEFLRVFRQLTYRHRSWDIWSDFIIMFACALSNPVDKDHFDERERRYICGLSKDTTPMTENDSLDNYWFTMMYFSDIWSMRRLLRSL